MNQSDPLQDINTLRGSLLVWVGVVWCYFVVAAYFYFNASYYVEKVSSFGRFILRGLG